MDTLFALSFNSALGLTSVALTYVLLNSLANQQSATIAIPVRVNEK